MATRWLPRPLPASCPCRPWFFRRRHPFFFADERGIREQLVEIELAELVEFPDQDGMDVFQHTFAGPFLEPAPAGAPRGQVDGDVPPSCAIAQQPKDSLQALAVIDPRSAGTRHPKGKRDRHRKGKRRRWTDVLYLAFLGTSFLPFIDSR